MARVDEEEKVREGGFFKRLSCGEKALETGVLREAEEERLNILLLRRGQPRLRRDNAISE
jgi:hypothetical protein